MTAELGEPSRGVEQDHWDLTLDRFGLECAEVGSDAAERLALAIAQLHGAVVEPPEPVLPPLRRAELCWRAHRLLLEWRKRTVAFPDWLDVLEQQLVLSGAQLWRERVGLEEEAGERALELFERLVVLFDPCPAWIRLSCLELRQLSPEQLCQELETALEDQEGDQVLLEQLALCCDRCCREALEGGDWGLAMERQAVAERTLHRLDVGHPHGSQARWEGYAALVIAIVDRLKPVLIGEGGHSLPDAERARLYDRVERMLKGYHALPIEPPEWLAVVELQLLQEGAQLWRSLIGQESVADQRTLDLFQRLAERLTPCPKWIRQTLEALSKAAPVRLELVYESDEPFNPSVPGRVAFNLAPLLSQAPSDKVEDFRPALEAFLEEQRGQTQTLVEASGSLYQSIGKRWRNGEELELGVFRQLSLAAELWNRLGTPGEFITLQPLDPGRHPLLIRLEAHELGVLQHLLFEGEAPAQGFEGWTDQDLECWSQGALACFTEVALWGDGAVWSRDSSSHWLYLPIVQALCSCSGVVPHLYRPPELNDLQTLIASREVLVVGPSSLADRRSDPSMRLLTPKPATPGAFEANLEELLTQVEGPLQEEPVTMVIVGSGPFRLPLCQELRRRHGLACIALGPELPELLGPALTS